MAGPGGDPAAVFNPSAVSTAPGGTGSITTWPVYWGGAIAGQDANDRRTGAQLPTKTVAEAYNAWNDPSFLSDQDKGHLAMSLYRAGLVSNPGNYDQVQAQWQQAVQDAAQANLSGKMVTPMQMLASKIAFAADVHSGKYGSGGYNSSSTTTSYNIPSPQDSEAIVKSVFQQGVGRDPTANELAKYSSMISGIAERTPVTSTSESTTDSQGNSRTKTTQKNKAPTMAGFQQAIVDQVQQNPEYGAYQAATTYYNAALQALSAPVHI